MKKVLTMFFVFSMPCLIFASEMPDTNIVRNCTSGCSAAVRVCCTHLTNQIQNAVTTLVTTITTQSQSLCNATIPITTIPFVITDSGNYCLTQDLVFSGTGAAITVLANNVTLNLDNHDILLTSSGVGIFIAGSHVTIQNGALTGSGSGIGIAISNAQKIIITDTVVTHFLHGLDLVDVSDVQVVNTQCANNQTGAAILATTNTSFDTCVFTGGDNGMVFSGANQDCRIVNSQFPSAIFSNLLVQQINGLLIDGCSFSDNGGDPTKANLVQFGDAALTQICNDVVMRNCTIINKQPALTTSPEGLGIYHGSGFLIDSCVIDIDNTNQDPTVDLSCVHISNPGLGISGTVASNVIVRNCVIQGPATNGLYPDVGSSGVVIEYCLASGAQKDGIFLAGTTNSTVQNNTVVNNGTNGIFLGETSTSNAINNNIVGNNGFNPILTSLPPFGNGISIAADSGLNTIQHNEVFNNTLNGINDQGTGNRIFYNSAYANPSANYVAATDIIITVAPGAASLAGQNVDA